jgi:hypothetical protein
MLLDVVLVLDGQNSVEYSCVVVVVPDLLLLMMMLVFYD